MRYFQLSGVLGSRAQDEVWRRQNAALVKRSAFSTSAVGDDASIWTEDPQGEALFRTILDERQVPYEEGDKQQVVTFLDRSFGR